MDSGDHSIAFKSSLAHAREGILNLTAFFCKRLHKEIILYVFASLA